ncbi:MAG: GntR family transcriptional regulator [Dehalococcoidia bacterium]|nr:GntR family transcriptional regulator [Dehalococcoidia bacterium]
MFDEASPIYRQIASRIKADLLSGVLAADEQIMSTNQYAAFYRINPATVARAFQQLVDEGVLYRRRGIGMFVNPAARETLLARHRERFFVDVVDPMAAEGVTIGIPIADIIRRLESLAKEDNDER